MPPFWHLRSDRVSLRVWAQGGYVDDVVVDGFQTPLHVAPWIDEPLDPSIPPMLANLRGDFFCAPFGEADVDPFEDRPHGATANRTWTPVDIGESSGHWLLDGTVNGAEVHKYVWLEPGSPLVFQKHTLVGGTGRVPVAHHLMLKTEHPIHLSFSDYDWIGTPPTPVEPDRSIGRSWLAYGRTFDRLEAAPLADGSVADLSVFPTLRDSDDLLMLRTAENADLGWTAASCPDDGWIFFSLKNPKELPGTVLWMSNGGRDYAPWNSRHYGVIGIEESHSWFHLGHQASTGPNPLSDAGRTTAVSLQPDGRVDIHYTFGFLHTPDAKRVRSIERDPAATETGGYRLAF